MGCGNNLISLPFRLLHRRLIECFRSCSPAVTWGGLWPWLSLSIYPFLTQILYSPGHAGRRHWSSNGLGLDGKSTPLVPVLRQLRGNSPVFFCLSSLQYLQCHVAAGLWYRLSTGRNRSVSDLRIHAPEKKHAIGAEEGRAMMDAGVELQFLMGRFVAITEGIPVVPRKAVAEVSKIGNL